MEQLSALHPNLGAQPLSAEVSADTSEPNPRLQLFDSSGLLLAERRFTGLPDCRQRAQAMAATLAVWLGDLSARVPPPVYPAAPGSLAAIERPTLKADASASASISAASTPGSSNRWKVEIGAGALASIDSAGDGVAGAELRTSMRPTTWRLGLQGHLSWEGSRELPLGEGYAQWQRVTLGAGLHLPLEWPGFGLELEVDALAGLLLTQGRDLTTSRIDAAVNPGGLAGVRFFIDPLSSGRAWLFLGGAFWPVVERVGAFSGPGQSPIALATLPQAELVAVLGGSWLK